MKLLYAFCALSIMAGAANAAPAKPPICDPAGLIPGCSPGPITTAINNATNETQALWAKIVSATQADLTYALALANNVASPGSKLRAQCYQAVLTANSQANGLTLKNTDGSPMVAPNPDAISKVEQAAELVDNLQPTAPVMAACAPAANAAAQSVTQLLSTLLAGVVIKAAVPLP